MRGSAAAALAAALALAAPSIAAGLQRLQVPAGAAVELSDGSQRDVAQLATQVQATLGPSIFVCCPLPATAACTSIPTTSTPHTPGNSGPCLDPSLPAAAAGLHPARCLAR